LFNQSTVDSNNNACSDGNEQLPDCAVNAAKNCRESLRKLSDLTYLCQDATFLSDLNLQLNCLIVSFENKIPHDGGLLLNCNASSNGVKHEKRQWDNKITDVKICKRKQQSSTNDSLIKQTKKRKSESKRLRSNQTLTTEFDDKEAGKEK
jgi:hypothetical protein